MIVDIDGTADARGLRHFESAARQAKGDVTAALAFATEVGGALPAPGGGATAELWSSLATVASVDLTVVRVLEPHLDAVAILGEAGMRVESLPGETWGVYAAERGGVRVTAEHDRLDGVKPWCSLADRVDRALVTAHVQNGRRLYAVDLRHPGVSVETDTWHARGLTDVTSTAVTFRDVPARPVGDPGWYLARPGFAWGGMGVAACWYGATVALADRLLASTASREPDQLALAGLGALDRTLHAARTVLAGAASAVDAGAASGTAGAVLAERVRGIVADAAEDALRTVGHLLGPAPLSLDEDHARRVADLTLYIRQHHGERDDARLGTLVREVGPSW